MHELDAIDSLLLEQIQRGEFAAAESTLAERHAAIRTLASASPTPALAVLLDETRDRGDRLHRLIEAIRENARAAIQYAGPPLIEPSRVDYSA
jgi:hypothetical protein